MEEHRGQSLEGNQGLLAACRGGGGNLGAWILQEDRQDGNQGVVPFLGACLGVGPYRPWDGILGEEPFQGEEGRHVGAYHDRTTQGLQRQQVREEASFQGQVHPLHERVQSIQVRHRARQACRGRQGLPLLIQQPSVVFFEIQL